MRNFGDSKVWAFAALYMLTTTNSYSIAYFMPLILEDGMGFGVAKAQCLTAPPYVAAAVVMYIQAIYADKLRSRGPLIAGNALLGMKLAIQANSCRLLTVSKVFWVSVSSPIWINPRLVTLEFSLPPSHVSDMNKRDDDPADIMEGNANCPALLTYQRYYSLLNV